MRYALKIALYIICFVAFFGTAEWYCRYKGYVCEYAPEDINKLSFFSSTLGWTPTSPLTSEDQERSLEEPCFETLLPNGARASYPYTRPKKPINVLVLGCSCTFGQGVNDNETYVWLLNERFPNITFDNFAYSGYGTLQCLLREEQLLHQHKYDYVIYAAISDHIDRNDYFVQCDPNDKSIEGLDIPTIRQTLKNLSTLWYMPTAYVKENGELNIQNAYYHWFGDTHSVVINTLKRLNILDQAIKHGRTRQEDRERLRELYWRLVYRMNEVAEQHNSKFATIFLANSDEPTLQPPTPEELTKYNKRSIKLASPLPFAFFCATNGREGENDNPKFHVGGDPRNHDGPIVHRSWAKHISEFIDGWIKD